MPVTLEKDDPIQLSQALQWTTHGCAPSPADLAYHADALGRAGPDVLHRLWRRLACMLAVTAEALAAAGGAHDALLGRLVLASGTLLASLALRANAPGAAALPADVPGALYAALRAARRRLPALQLEKMEGAKSLGALVGALHAAAGTLGTALMQVRESCAQGNWGPS